MPNERDRVIPITWLQSNADPERVILHWTAGGYRANGLDKQHYHVILQDHDAIGDGSNVLAIKGVASIAANDNTSDGFYAAHTRGLNTKSVGLSLACMGGAIQGKTHGKWPLTKLLWERGAQAVAEICHFYKIPINERTVLQHSEVEKTYGIKQKGKWDCSVKPWEPNDSPEEVYDEFRRKVRWYYAQLED